MGRNTTRRKQLKAKEKEEKTFQEKLLANIERMREENIKAEEAKTLREKMKEEWRERDKKEAILMMQIIDYSPRSKKYFDDRKRDALESWSARELFSNSSTTSNDYHPHMGTEDAYHPHMASEDDE